jgi:hypothetical protein
MTTKGGLRERRKAESIDHTSGHQPLVSDSTSNGNQCKELKDMKSHLKYGQKLLAPVGRSRGNQF